MGSIVSWFMDALSRRPWWMNALMLFCAFMTLVYVPWDLFVKPAAMDEEVWFGILFRGRAAKLTGLAHWAVYAAGAYGFWRMRPWMWPWAAVYAAQLAFSMFVWGAWHVGGFGGFMIGLVSLAPFAVLALALANAKEVFQGQRPSLRQRYGEWALITGASSGIGREFARALARDGVSCALSARREDRLQALAAELERLHGVATRVIPVDLADPQGVDRLAAAVGELEIGVLVNNAGFGYAGRLEKQDTERLRSLVQVNCVAPLVLTSRLLPQMRARGRGAIIITGSIAGQQPLPRLAAYSASKGFDRLLGESLWGELRGTGVDVLVLEPGPTDTEFQATAGEVPHPGEPPGDVVRVALEALGNQPAVVSGWFNWLRGVATRFLPRSILTLIADGVTVRLTPAEMR
jgi:short-subunit dehydrogenase